MKYIVKTTFFLFLVFNLCLTNVVSASEEINKKIKELEKIIGSSFKSLVGKSLNKEETKKFLSEYVLVLSDERDDGTVTYFFDEREYFRYKNYQIISKGAWRFTKNGSLRIFNRDIKLTWKIKPKTKKNRKSNQY